MARPGIASLKRTKSKSYWPSRAAPGKDGTTFETKASCREEDAFRIKSLKRAAADYPAVLTGKKATKLSKRIGKAETLASALYTRRVRNSVFSQVWRLVDAEPRRVTTATIIKRGWKCSPDELARLDLAKLSKAFVSDIDRKGAAVADGWMIAFWHGEYETPPGIVRLHLHVIAAGEMIDVLDALRKGDNYKFEANDDVRHRVKIEREPLTHLPHPLTYCFKSYWPWKHRIEGEAGKRRTRDHKRIPEPVHSQVLMFLDRHEVNDLVVVKGLSVKRGSLIVSKRGNE